MNKHVLAEYEVNKSSRGSMQKENSIETMTDLQLSKVPQHVAIIMDGNNRWAKAQKLPVGAGHKAGVDSVRKVIETCAKHNIKFLTLFAFSSENWQRPKAEVSSLMKLFLNALKREANKLNKNNIRLRVIGNRLRFSETIQKHMAEVEQLTVDNDGCTVIIAADYGGQWDIAEAARKLAEKVVAGQLQLSDINPDTLNDEISIGDLPPPDLCIRTGGEQRISNFLLWQMAYSELYFTDLYWPDFDEQAFLQALKAYANRERRFGHTSNSVEN